MRRFLTGLIIVPLVLLLVLFAVANRRPVTLAFDPFAPETPAYSLDVPLFLVIFGAVMLGVVVGGLADWFGQGRYRREARSRRADMRRQERELDKMRSTSPGTSLPVPYEYGR